MGRRNIKWLKSHLYRHPHLHPPRQGGGKFGVRTWYIRNPCPWLHVGLPDGNSLIKSQVSQHNSSKRVTRFSHPV